MNLLALAKSLAKGLITALLLCSAVSGAHAASVNRHVVVIVMENKDAAQIYGNTADAPYINSVLMKRYARALNFIDELPSASSEAHYIYMEAGTNAFTDHTFLTNADPSAQNSTASRQHLSRQITQAPGLDWVAYQQGLSQATGLCPVKSDRLYVARHNPFVFFKDVAGNPPSPTNAFCIAHHKRFAALADDLLNNRLPAYTFITPDLCNDMHGNRACASSNQIRTGDTWLKNHLPRLIAWANANDGVIFLTWDEGKSTAKIPFLAIGPHVKKGYANVVSYDHGSMIKTIEMIFGLPLLDTVVGKNDLSGLFVSGHYP